MTKILGGVADRIGANFSPNVTTLKLKHDAGPILGLKVENGFNKGRNDEWKTVVSQPRVTCSDKLF